MASLFTNWKTTLAGVIVIALGAAHTMGINVPGFTMDLGPALTAGIGLIFASDASK